MFTDDKPDLVIAGTGTKKIHEMTMQTYWACEEADVITGIFLDNLFVSAIEQEFEADVLNFTEEYKKWSEDRYESFYEVIMATLSLANEEDTFVTCLGAGHPSMLNSTTKCTYTMAKYWDIDARLYPGVSAIDSICAQLGIDPIRHGVQQYMISTAIDQNITLNPGSYFIGWRLVGVLQSDEPDNNPIYDYLAQYYPDDRICLVSTSPITPYRSGKIQEMQLSDLPSLTEQDFQIATLVVTPPYDEEEWQENQYQRILGRKQFEKIRAGTESDIEVGESPLVEINPSDTASKIVELNRRIYAEGKGEFKDRDAIIDLLKQVGIENHIPSHMEYENVERLIEDEGVLFDIMQELVNEALEKTSAADVYKRHTSQSKTETTESGTNNQDDNPEDSYRQSTEHLEGPF